MKSRGGSVITTLLKVSIVLSIWVPRKLEPKIRIFFLSKANQTVVGGRTCGMIWSCTASWNNRAGGRSNDRIKKGIVCTRSWSMPAAAPVPASVVISSCPCTTSLTFLLFGPRKLDLKGQNFSIYYQTCALWFLPAPAPQKCTTSSTSSHHITWHFYYVLPENQTLEFKIYLSISKHMVITSDDSCEQWKNIRARWHAFCVLALNFGQR